MMANVRLRLAGMVRAIEAKADPWSGTVSFGGRTHRIDEWEWAAPVDGAMYGVALNDEKEWEALSTEMNAPPYEKPPEGPVLYMKPANTINAHRRPVLLPRWVKHLQAAPALGLVIGRTAARVRREQALDFVFGYTIVNDLSIPHEQRHRPAVKEQARDGFAPVGPWIVPKEEASPLSSLTARVYVNGRLVQRADPSRFRLPVEQWLAEVTEFMTLYPGDVLFFSWPADAPLVTAGDVVRIEIERIGVLENEIALEQGGDE
ncbi:4-hydroxyphenylacetate degradation bifunctional isomerase/decarboxylase, HpaG1 subunit [Geobacillus thermoleovorans CCB_US3_UF5]|uniref:5-carboxymethyl-2-oxo-hex-3-ene-1,7-dioate decarboxylase n=4 Tax=Geobacillus TaxID=129337 RepID=A0A1Q5SYH3_9BACL|nr:4-hydroxyphenylacetate degradation bifunctional isomerase/decarboxylase, HpaG1 subunit [Geobacillus thermoleovorans CCB_US3_UF5]OKO93000.1 5-carboxymethyl-2-oxo-hex-3- ene-1,7-dioate decarboxylase [Geobacillus proteiniphilus]